jgi:outer membrane protein assembly factor BamA
MSTLPPGDAAPAPSRRGAGARGILAVAALWLLAAALLPAPAARAEDRRVAAIEVTGARRTRESVVLRVAAVRPGDPYTPGLEETVRQRLMNTQLFYEVRVAAVPAGADVALRIEVRDKWSLLPFPLLSVREDATTYGVTLMETNLLGYHKMLFLSLMNSDGAWNESLFYGDKHLLGSRFTLFGWLLHLRTTQDVWDEDREVGAFEQLATGGGISLGYRFGERATLSVSFRGSDTGNREPEDAATLPEDARERSLGVTIDLDGLDYDEDRQRGLTGRLTVEQGIAALGDELRRTQATGEVRCAAPVPGGLLGLRAIGMWGDPMPPGYRFRTDFLRGYERGRFQPDRLLGGTAEYRVPLATFREATLSVVGFGEAALLRDEYRSFAFADLQGDVGAAFAVYVRRVALPMLQVYAAYGVTTKTLLPGFSLGFAF